METSNLMFFFQRAPDLWVTPRIDGDAHQVRNIATGGDCKRKERSYRFERPIIAIVSQMRQM